MSKRPTNITRRNLSTAHSATNNFGYAIIGDTAAATLYAKRLLGNNVTQPISIIIEGVDRFNVEDLTDVAFAANNNKRILHYVKPEQIHMIPAGDNNDDPDDHIIQNEQIIHYHVGVGPNGDFISAYTIPRAGPWFTHSSNGRLERFLSESTVKSNLNSQEVEVVNRLSQIWGLNQTSSLVVKGPSILNAHYEFLQLHDNTAIREIFQDEYHMVNQATNVDYVTETGNLRFTGISGGSGTSGMSGGLYNITANNLSLTSVRPIWKTNPYTYLRLAGEGGLNPGQLLLPTFYRAVLSIPIGGSGASGFTGLSGCTAVASPPGYVCFSCTGFTGHSGISGCSATFTCGSNTCTCFCNPPVTSQPPGGPILSPLSICYVGLPGLAGINFIGVPGTEDLITSHVTFSLYDIANPKSSSLAWLVQAYTTPEDLSVVHPDGKYADLGRHLLIIEALSTKNKRRTSYNNAEHEIQVNYNDRLAEQGYLTQFAHIVASVYNAYTGMLIPVQSLLDEASVCSANSGTCQDANYITDYSLRQSPMISVIELASHLYGVDIYPNPSKV